MPSPSKIDRTGGEIDWPPTLDRTSDGERASTSKFSVTLASALSGIETELEDRLDVDDYRISTAAPHRKRDGRPYADASPDDPGIVVRWSMDGEQYAIAADHYTGLRDNARALGLYLTEKRKMDDRPVRTGQSEFATARLPPADGEPDAVAAPLARSSNGMPEAEAREVLGVTADTDPDVVEASVRRLSRKHHPDSGEVPDRETFARVRKAESILLD
ncbi:J domain-containing protein [Halorubellus sp. JP-L1]|uniref:J domain-containing protein n=1 Tax=Halorubellus sp. JP-L1 TaxID=2715753 RepID=UPI00140C08CF|nr:J domain-containing protein [Halorubellus sp. JP-L1]NHN40530.1 J domain-containing protein [Halorubellus sp. JP-L1]